MAEGVKSSNTAVTDRDKVEAARSKDLEKNIKSSTDVSPAEQTAAHALLPSDIEAFATQHTLTQVEASRVLNATENGTASNTQQVIDLVKEGRTVNRPVYIEQPAGLSHPMASVPDVPVAPVPSAQELDPTAPALDDPTAYVVREGDNAKPSPDEVADNFAENIDKMSETVDEVVNENRDNEGPQIPTE